MCDPVFAGICKGVEIDSRDTEVVDDVFARFQVPPEIAVAQWARSEEESEDKHIHFKGSFERCVHTCELGLVSKEPGNGASDLLEHTGHSTF